MNYDQVMSVNAKAQKAKKGLPPKMVSMEYKPSENGGHVFTHRMESEDGHFHEPETHAFGKEQGKEALAHFAKHAGIKMGKGPDGDEE